MTEAILAPIATSRHINRTIPVEKLKTITEGVLSVYADGEAERSVKAATKKHKDLVARPEDFKKAVLATARHALEIKLGEFRHKLYPRVLRLAGAVAAENLDSEASKDLDPNLIFELDGIRYVIDCKKQDNRGADSRKALAKEMIFKKEKAGAAFAYLWFCVPSSNQKGREMYSTAFAEFSGIYACYGNDLFRLLNITCDNAQGIIEVVEGIIANNKFDDQIKAAIAQLSVT